MLCCNALGFEEQLVGAKTGDHVEVKVTFPEEYQAKELAGKEAVFQCDVKKIEAKELPELDDDFAKDVSEFDTLAEYKEDVKKNLTEKKAEDARRAKEDAAVDKVIENAQMDIPEAMIETQTRQVLLNVFFVLSKCIKLRYIFSKVIIKLRKLFSFNFLNIALEYSFFTSEFFSLILLRECNLNLFVITCLSTNKLLLESRDKCVGTKCQRVICSFTALECFSVYESLKVNCCC